MAFLKKVPSRAVTHKDKNCPREVDTSIHSSFYQHGFEMLCVYIHKREYKAKVRRREMLKGCNGNKRTVMEIKRKNCQEVLYSH